MKQLTTRRVGSGGALRLRPRYLSQTLAAATIVGAYRDIDHPRERRFSRAIFKGLARRDRRHLRSENPSPPTATRTTSGALATATPPTLRVKRPCTTAPSAGVRSLPSSRVSSTTRPSTHASSPIPARRTPPAKLQRMARHVHREHVAHVAVPIRHAAPCGAPNVVVSRTRFMGSASARSPRSTPRPAIRIPPGWPTKPGETSTWAISGARSRARLPEPPSTSAICGSRAWRGASLQGARFNECLLDRACFDGANLD
jgi:hypothetical protein